MPVCGSAYGLRPGAFVASKHNTRLVIKGVTRMGLMWMVSLLDLRLLGTLLGLWLLLCRWRLLGIMLGEMQQERV